jgi:phosphorylase kinase alpha/beta subunit
MEIPLSKYAADFLWFASLAGDYKDRIWLRDSIYCLMCYMFDKRENGETQEALDQMILLLEENPARPPVCFDKNLKPLSIKDFQTGDSADIQNDVIGEILWIYAAAKNRAYKLGSKWRKKIHELVDILEAERYWEQPDSGIWEMEKDIRASSIGICVAGLTQLSSWPDWENDKVDELIHKGEESLKHLLPRETPTREYDAALLNLVWPFRVVNKEMGIRIIGRTFDNLMGEVGIKRFIGDPYFNYDNEEAEWAMFAPQILLALNTIGLFPKTEEFNAWKSIKKIKAMNYPESFVGKEKRPNRNTPLAWTHAMCILADMLLGKGKKK